MDARRAYVRLCVYIDATLLLRGRPFNSWGGGGGWVILKKNFLPALVGRKKLHAAQM